LKLLFPLQNLLRKVRSGAIALPELEEPIRVELFPGVRENGGQYTHAAIWSVLAGGGVHIPLADDSATTMRALSLAQRSLVLREEHRVRNSRGPASDRTCAVILRVQRVLLNGKREVKATTVAPRSHFG
jgi:hypothetical protein